MEQYIGEKCLMDIMIQVRRTMKGRQQSCWAIIISALGDKRSKSPRAGKKHRVEKSQSPTNLMIREVWGKNGASPLGREDSSGGKSQSPTNLG